MNLDAKQQVLRTTEELRESFSGVNLNEEAVRLIELQRAFQSMLRVIQTVDSMRLEVINPCPVRNRGQSTAPQESALILRLRAALVTAPRFVAATLSGAA